MNVVRALLAANADVNATGPGDITRVDLCLEL